jgi:tRNA A-37 threonylcarbamoyl transferase component Bud32
MPANLLSLAARLRSLARPAGWVTVHPRYRRRFARLGLTRPRDFLSLRGEVVSGHADRHVVRVVLGHGLDRFAAFLKREHRVPWCDRLGNAWAGFGWVSKSEREARLLHELRRKRIPVPRWLAYGEDGHGRAFLLVRSLSRAVDLRTFLHRAGGWPPWRRRQLASRLGRLLARVHAAGFDCPDLWSKHVFVRPRRLTVALIDWQRSRRRPWVPWAVRVRDLSALHASLAGELAGPRDRLLCLRTYLRASLGRDVALRDWAMLVERQAARLRRRRSVRELHRPPLPGPAQRLRWLDGEALCVTRAFWQSCRGRVPSWLRVAARETVARPQQTDRVWGGQRLILRQSPPASRLWHWLARLRGRRVASPVLRQAGLVFRLERSGVAGPRLLAFGQRPDGTGFVLLQPPADAVPLTTWLAVDRPGRVEVIRAAGALLRRLHEAGCRLTSQAALHVRSVAGLPIPTLADVSDVRPGRRVRGSAREWELAAAVRSLGLTQVDAAAFEHGYRTGDGQVLGVRRPQAEAAAANQIGVPARHA